MSRCAGVLKPLNKTGANQASSKRISQVELINNMIETGSVFDNPLFYRYFSENSNLAKEMIKNWYGWQLKVDEIESLLGPSYVGLLLDPGIANRLEQIVNKLKEEKRNFESVWEARRWLVKQFGTHRLFRGIVLKETDILAIESQGLVAPGFLDSKWAQSALSYFFAVPKNGPPERTIPSNPIEEYISRKGGFFDSEKSMYLSVSVFREVAESVGYYSSKYAGKPGYKMYVLEIEVPEISLIREGGLFSSIYPSSLGWGSTLTIPPNFKVGMDDSNIELFIPYRIQSSWIKKIHEVGIPNRPEINRK